MSSRTLGPGPLTSARRAVLHRRVRLIVAGTIELVAEADESDFKSLLLADADLMKGLTPQEVEKAFDLDELDAMLREHFGRGFRHTVINHLEDVADRVSAGDFGARARPSHRS